MQEKKCFKCGRMLPLSEFYAHPQMGDGHLNKCKECTKKDVHDNYVRNSENMSYVEKERERGRDKYLRLGYVRHKSKTMLLTNGFGARCINRTLRSQGVNTKGMECHHWNYNNLRSVFLLTRKAHKAVHRHLNVNYDTGVVSTDNGVELTNIKQAISETKRILLNEGLDTQFEVYNLTSTITR